MTDFIPFQNEEDTINIGELTIENRLDRLSLYGSLQITKDKAGLALAESLKSLLDATVSALKAETLPDHITVQATDSVDNPFQ